MTRIKEEKHKLLSQSFYRISSEKTLMLHLRKNPSFVFVITCSMIVLNTGTIILLLLLIIGINVGISVLLLFIIIEEV